MFKIDEGPQPVGSPPRGCAEALGGGDANDVCWRAESGLIWDCRGLGEPMVDSNGL
jgi:hypothetical protein